MVWQSRVYIQFINLTLAVSMAYAMDMPSPSSPSPSPTLTPAITAVAQPEFTTPPVPALEELLTTQKQKPIVRKANPPTPKKTMAAKPNAIPAKAGSIQDSLPTIAIPLTLPSTGIIYRCLKIEDQLFLTFPIPLAQKHLLRRTPPANRANKMVTVYSLSEKKNRVELSLGFLPENLAYYAPRHQLYVSDRNGHLAIIDTETLAIVDQRTIPKQKNPDPRPDRNLILELSSLEKLPASVNLGPVDVAIP
jgi:hypothetical protein